MFICVIDMGPRKSFAELCMQLAISSLLEIFEAVVFNLPAGKCFMKRAHGHNYSPTSCHPLGELR